MTDVFINWHSVLSKRQWRRRCLSALFLVLPLCPVNAAAPPWPDSSFTYISDGQKLPEVISRFGKTFGLETRLTPEITSSTSQVNGKITSNNPTDFINQISSAYGLSWFVQGGVLYVSRNNERVIKSLMPPGISAAGLKKALMELGVIESKFGWGDVPERGMVLVSGPPAYVELVLRSVQEIPTMPPAQELQVFRLRHAPVDDRTIFYRDRRIVTPGVATILRGLISGESRGGTNIILSELAAPLRNNSAPLINMDEESSQSRPDSGNAVPVSPGLTAPGRGVIQADPRLNAVVVRDKPENMQIYRQLISLLDVPSQLVEIEAMILDVNANQVAQLGIDWSAKVGRVSGNFGRPSDAESNTSALISLGSANAATIVSNAANFLVTRINALESRGQAKIVSRPSILTLDNQGALIDLAETFFIESLGERVASVTPVSVGVTLKVTPHIIEENGKKSVQLVVDIEDGSRTEKPVRGLPSIQRSNIGTQAVINEHDSLLIGGFNSESTIRSKDAIPLLSELPVVGALFGNTKATVQRKQRLFLITPRIIPSGLTTQPALLQQASSHAIPVPSVSEGMNAASKVTPIKSSDTASNIAPLEDTPERRQEPLKIRMDTQIKGPLTVTNR